MSVMENQREQEQVIGTLVGVRAKSPGKWQAVVLPDGKEGTDHTRNLWTDKEAQINSLAPLIGQRLGFVCNVSHWNMNDGTPVRSLWIDQVGGAAPPAPAEPMSNWEAAQAAQAAAGPQYAPQAAPMPQVVAQPANVTVTQQVSGDVKEQRIHRQTASKVAAIMLSHVAPEERTMSTLLILAERLVAYYNEGLPAIAPVTLDDLITQAMPASMEGAPMFADEREGPAVDDDIPF